MQTISSNHYLHGNTVQYQKSKTWSKLQQKPCLITQIGTNQSTLSSLLF